MNLIIPIWVFWIMVGILVLFLGAIVYLAIKLFTIDKSDIALFFDSNMRWSIIRSNFKFLDKLDIRNKNYFLKENLGFVNNKGKTLYIFHENNAQPMKVDKHVGKWLDPQSLKGVINNKLVQLMLKPKDSFTDMLLMLGAIGGMVAGLSGVVILLIQVGVI